MRICRATGREANSTRPQPRAFREKTIRNPNSSRALTGWRGRAESGLLGTSEIMRSIAEASEVTRPWRTLESVISGQWLEQQVVRPGRALPPHDAQIRCFAGTPFGGDELQVYEGVRGGGP